LASLETSQKDIEEKILSLLKNNLMSVTQISKELGLRKDVGSAILESMKKQGKLELHKVGRSKIYTIPNILTEEKKEEDKKVVKKIRSIGIVSGKGGTGKTTVTLNLAGALMDFNDDVIAVDADVKMSGLGLNLGFYTPSNTLNDVIKNNLNILEALHLHSSGLRVIPASLNVESIELSNLYNLFENYLTENSTILVDSPPGLEENSIKVLRSCKEILVVTTPKIQSLTNSIKVIDKAKELNVRPLGVIVNRYTGSKPQKKIIEEIDSICEIPLLGIIPEDKAIKNSVLKNTPNIFLNPHSKASRAFREIAAKISGNDYDPPKFSFIRNIWGKIA